VHRGWGLGSRGCESSLRPHTTWQHGGRPAEDDKAPGRQPESPVPPRPNPRRRT
jgi:hypothetical protein